MNLTLLQNNFISGEVSPLLEGRIDSPRYQTGLRLCQNYLPMRQGGLRKRPGTMYAGAPAAKARLIEFHASDGNQYVIELSNLKARIWTPAYALVGGGTPTEITTPWTTAQLDGLKYAAMNGVLWIVHPSHAPRTITLSGSTWSIATPTFTGDRTFASSNNYPRAVFFIAGRLGLAGTNAEPTAVFLSRPPNAATGATRFTEFDFDASDDGILAPDDAIYLLESDISAVLWAIGTQRLFIGTRRAVWMDTGQGVTPAAFDTSILSYTGASEPQAVASETITLYAGRGGQSIHALVYNSQAEAYQDIDLTQDAEHFLSSPIVDMKIQNFPEPILWMAREDGLLVSCSLDLAHGMVAWARHPMSGSAVVESIAVTHGDDEDVLWLSVLRGSARTIEYLRTPNMTTTSQEDFHFVDCGVAVTNGSPSAVVSGLSHLEGRTVTAWADGAVLPDKVVSGGAVTYDSAFTKAHVGLAIASEARTLRPETPANGTGQGKQKRIERAVVRLFRSIGGSIGALDGSQAKLLTWKSGTYLWGSSPELYTGDLEAQIAAALNTDAVLDLQHATPSPFVLLAIIYRVAVMEV